jgi:Domain of unknown function (DUF6458)
MGIGIGIVLIAVGAILRFAVSASTSGVNLQTVGVILMIVGAVGILLDLIILMPRRRHAVATTAVDGQPTVTREYTEGGI